MAFNNLLERSEGVSDWSSPSLLNLTGSKRGIKTCWTNEDGISSCKAINSAGASSFAGMGHKDPLVGPRPFGQTECPGVGGVSAPPSLGFRVRIPPSLECHRTR